MDLISFLMTCFLLVLCLLTLVLILVMLTIEQEGQATNPGEEEGKLDDAA